MRWIVILLGTYWAGAAYPVEDGGSYDRVQLNWSTMRISFFGIGESPEDFEQAKSSAIKEGIGYIVSSLPSIREASLTGEHSSAKQDHKSVALQVSKNTYTAGTTYYASGKVRVKLESSLPRALAPVGLVFPKSTPDEDNSKNSGLLIKINKAMDPQMIYEVRSREGEVLFHLKDVAESEFYKNFMGRYYSSKNSSQAKYYVGKDAIEISGDLQGDRIIVVDKASWVAKMQDNQGILERSKVAILSK